MKIIEIPQNSPAWSAWRGKGLGASNAPVIMGVSPWESAFGLWTQLTGMCTRPDFHPLAVAAMQRGHDLEPTIRALVEAKFGVTYPSVNGEDDTHPFIRASYDGYNADTTLAFNFTEIKAPGKVDHAKAVKGNIPDKYFPQVQQQSMVAGGVAGIYASWDGQGVPEGTVITHELANQLIADKHMAVLPIVADLEYQGRLREALVAFWSRVQAVIPPDADTDELEKLTRRLKVDLGKVQNTVNALECLAGALVKKAA